MFKKSVLIGFLLCSIFSVAAQTQSTIQNPSLFHYFTFSEKHKKINEATFRSLQEFASKSCNIKIFVHAGKLCYYFEGHKIPCMGYADFVHELIRAVYSAPQTNWRTLLRKTSAAYYGSAGEMILAFFGEKQQYKNDPAPALLVQHQYLFDRMLSRTEKSAFHNRRIRRARAELDLLTLQHFAKAVRFRLAHMPADLKKRCLAVWKEEDLAEKDPSFQKTFKHFRSIYMDQLRTACKAHGLEL